MRSAAFVAAVLCAASLAAAQEIVPAFAELPGIMRQDTVPGEGPLSNVNPCPGNKKVQGAPACERVQIPEGLCSVCPLNEPLSNGKFKSCKNIFNLDAPGCKGKMEEYVMLNPCDTVRKGFVEKWDQNAKDNLDYFAYALCEQCCDNVPQGAKIEEYGARNKATTLWSLDRGNGPAHFHYDICAIWPNFKAFKLPWLDENEERPPICPQLQAWLDGPDSTNWVANANAKMSPDIKRTIADSMWAFECHDYKLWTSCVNLESKQGRV